MIIFYKILFLFQFIVISVFGASASIDNNNESDPRIFFYYKDAPELSMITIQYTSLNLDNIKVLKNNRTNVAALEYYAEEKTLFWTTSKGELYSTVWNEDKDVEISEGDHDEDPDDDDISSYEVIRPKKGNIKLLYTNDDWYPRSMALDEIGKKLYIADSSERTIDVFDLNGKNKARIFASDHVIPCEIAIDPSEGLLFLYGINFLQGKTELHRMNMDGSDHRLIINTIENLTETILRINSNFVIDRENKRIYYKPCSDNIAMTDYEGHDTKFVLKNERVAYFGIYKNHLYWTKRYMKDDYFLDPVRRFIATLFSSSKIPVFSCNLSNQINDESSFSCRPILKSRYKSRNFVSSFKIFDFVPAKKGANPCLKTNNTCEDHCLLKSSGLDKKLTFGCACRLGRKLNHDQRTCSDIKEETVDDESVPYVYENVLMLYNNPFNFTAECSKNEDTLHTISTNFASNFLYGSKVVSDNALKETYSVTSFLGIYKSHNGKHVTLLGNSSENMSKVTTYDWVSKNLYYAILNDNSTKKYNLFVMATKNPEKGKFLGQIDSPTAMAVHPYRGYLFIATYDKSKKESHIIRFNTDGKEKFVFPYTNNSNILLTLDMTEDKVYWIDENSLRTSNLDGRDIKLLMNIRFPSKATKISTYGDHIYIKLSPIKKLKTLLYIFNKTGEECANFPLNMLEGVLNNAVATKQKVKKTDTQYLSAKNPCTINNGGCDLLCFAVPTNNSQSLQKVCSS